MPWFGWLRRRRREPADSLQEISSTVLVGGRERVKGVPYTLPRDLEETNRLDFQHYILRYAFQGNYAAPIKNPKSILDVGTGTGRWARDMAQLFPRAEIVGTDMVPPPVDEAAEKAASVGWRPNNYQFVTSNVLEGLPFPDSTFDFVHQRLLFLAIPTDRWPFVIGELVRVTRPGGWVELVEIGSPERGGLGLDLFAKWLSELAAFRGVDVALSSQIGNMLLQRPDLAQVSGRRIDVPCGAWGGRIGNMMATDLIAAVQSVSGLVVRQGLASAEQFEQALATARADANSPQVHGVAPFYLAYGRRMR